MAGKPWDGIGSAGGFWLSIGGNNGISYPAISSAGEPFYSCKLPVCAQLQVIVFHCLYSTRRHAGA